MLRKLARFLASIPEWFARSLGLHDDKLGPSAWLKNKEEEDAAMKERRKSGL